MEVTHYYGFAPINWAALPELPARLARHGIIFERATVQLSRYPDTIEHDSLDAASAEVLSGFRPSDYSIHARGKLGGLSVTLRIFRQRNMHLERLQSITLEGSTERAIVQSVAEFLGLAEDDEPTPVRALVRSAFIAHRFDDLGTSFAEKLARLLELLDFSVLSGRGFAPISVAEKVRARLLSQAIVVAILTPGDEATWLVQESVLAEARSKPLFVLRDHDATFKPGLLGDLEYIPFHSPTIETAFLPFLEGLRELGYFGGKARSGSA